MEVDQYKLMLAEFATEFIPFRLPLEKLVKIDDDYEVRTN
jgi:hypothetical protein